MTDVLFGQCYQKVFTECMKTCIIYSPYEGIPDVELLYYYFMFFLENADDDSDERRGFQLT